ncbi:MAG: tRNA pseudouridine(38-40) synthase TruA [Draconibacterium sp.]|nr:MAG: tRNA pseudouridine(38-40) synthase TruA [Draconibacterium sp.]
MSRYFLQISYNGSCYHGWQVQPNAVTVQEVMENALSTLLREKIAVIGAGRTDTGVHAQLYMLHFDSQNNNLHNENLVYKLNRYLPEDIAVQHIFHVKADAHTRFDAISRTYQYVISTFKNPFITNTAWYFNRPVNLEKMNEACIILLEFSDFTSFARLHTNTKTNICKIMHAEWEQKGELMVFTIKADRFLRNMVRAIVGTLVDVGLGKISLDDFRAIIEKKDRAVAGTSAPAHGLSLTQIEYPVEIFQ